MNEVLKFLASFVAGLILVETFVYLINKWIVHDLSPPHDGPDNNS